MLRPVASGLWEIDPGPALPILAGAFDAQIDTRRSHVRFVVPTRLNVVARVQPLDDARRSYLRVLDVSIAGFRWLARGYKPGYEVGQDLRASISWGHRRLTCTVQVQWRRATEVGVELGVRIRSLEREDYDTLHQLIRETQQRALRRTHLAPEEVPLTPQPLPPMSARRTSPIR